jgi:hypothetical protein
MILRLLIFIFLLTISTILHAQRKWERSLQPIDVAALPSAQIQSGQESLKKEMIIAGRMNVAAGGPFIACSIGWNEDGVAATNSQLRISTSRDSSEWSAWIDLPTDGHAVEAKWQACTQLVYLPAGSRYWKIEVTSNLLSKGRVMKRMEINFFDPGPTPPTEVNAVKEPNGPTACPCEKPNVVTRAGWSCPQTNNPGYGYTTVTHLVVHHSAGTNTASDWPAIVLAIWNSHVYTNGWADIGYNYLIDPQGRLYEGRGGGDNVLGAHFCGTNGGTMGACMLGTYTTASITDTSRNMLTRLLAWKACGSSINPSGSSWHPNSARTLNHISGHRDGCATECPGTMTFNQLGALRTAVANQIAACNMPTSLREIPGLRSFRITPNPVRGGRAIAEFELAGARQVQYMIYTTDGRELFASKPRRVAGRASFPLEGLDNAGKGAVFVVFRVDNGGFTQRLFVE